MTKPPFTKLVLTGGPCGGKTTAMARLSSYLRQRGYSVVTVPEVYSLLATNSSVTNPPSILQTSVMELQISMEDNFERLVRATGLPGVMICDRGVMDGSAYMDSNDWEDLLVEQGTNNAELREGRYNAVLHLVTAAEGAERYYTVENHATRLETPDEARVLDAKTRVAWVGHPQLMVFDNTTDFEGKLRRVVRAVARLVGLCDLERVTRKYVLRGCELELFPVEVTVRIFEVEKVYVHDSGNGKDYSFARKRSHVSNSGLSLGTTYGLTMVKVARDGEQNIERKRIITAREYASAYQSRDRSRHVVTQRRISFLYKLQSFTVHCYQTPRHMEGLCILHVQGDASTQSSSDIDEHDGNFELPEFLNVERRIENNREDEEKYGAFNISLKKEN